MFPPQKYEKKAVPTNYQQIVFHMENNTYIQSILFQINFECQIRCAATWYHKKRKPSPLAYKAWLSGGGVKDPLSHMNRSISVNAFKRSDTTRSASGHLYSAMWQLHLEMNYWSKKPPLNLWEFQSPAILKLCLKT